MSTLTNKIKKEAQELIKNGAERTKVEGFLLFQGVSKKEANGFLKESGLIGRKTFRDQLYARCINGKLDMYEFEELIQVESANTQKHISHYNEIRVAMNAIHDKYTV